MPRVLIGIAAVWALTAHTGLFHQSDWMQGDIAYHRGVAYTMSTGEPQGEGPLLGLLTYYGGLYPLGLTSLSRLSGWTFESVLSWVSWPSVLLIPGATWVLSRAIWPGNRLLAATAFFLAVVAAPLAVDPGRLWVSNVLPSASSFWPLYPRDVALALLPMMAATIITRRSVGGWALAGLLLGLMVLFHLQIALFGGLLLLAVVVERSWEMRSGRPIGWLGVALLTAFLLSAWWLVPRLLATFASHGLLIADYPGAERLAMDPIEFVIQFGVVAVLVALVLVRHIRVRIGPRLLLPLVWLLGLAPLLLLARLDPELGLVTERRIWLVASPALVVVAAAVLTVLIDQAPRWRQCLIVGAVMALSAPGTAATSATVRSLWSPDPIVTVAGEVQAWTRVFAEARRNVLAAPVPEVITYDWAAATVWSQTGARVPSLWLPGSFKLGFDPEVLTGEGYLQRNRALGHAFARGLAGLCPYAASRGIDWALLYVEDSALGTFDKSFASPYRVDPRDRSPATLDRVVGPGVRYLDLGREDVLRLDPGAVVTVPWSGEAIERLAIVIRRLHPGDEPLLEVQTGADTVTVSAPGSRTRVSLPVDGVPGPIRLLALEPVELRTITGFTPAPGLVGGTDGPRLIETRVLCPEGAALAPRTRLGLLAMEAPSVHRIPRRG